ncbi:MAG TPA: SIR2 family protein [Steroidobacteraceae bacterium]|nr:SIR2 family protein [Steroidobacteraceae bacterium]
MDPSRSEIDPRLLEDIRAGTCVAFVGAGFSAAAGLPAWPDLVRAVAQGLPPAERAEHRATLDRLLEREPPGVHAQRELEMAAQLLFDAVGEERCRALLRDALHPERLPERMQRRLKHLLGIPFRAIVTTNFDPLLPGVPPDAMAYRRLLRGVHPGPWRESVLRAALGIAVDPASPSLDSPDRPVVQLHGTLVHDASLVFTRSQYRRRLYANPAYLTALKALLATSTVLFLGYSMRDAYLNELRAELIEAFQTSEAALRDPVGADPALALLRRPLAWAVLEDVSDVARVCYERHEGLGVLAYRTGGDGEHAGFDDILAQIYDQTNPVHRLGQLLHGRRLLWVDPAPDDDALGRRLLAEAVREVEGSTRGLHRHVVTVTTCTDAIAKLRQSPTFDLVVARWRYDAGLRDGADGEALLRAVAGLRAGGVPVPPVTIFAGAEHGPEERGRALQLGAIGFTSDWARLMTAIEHVLADT